MKLLIVDDQPGVLEGLTKGIDWEAEGISCVAAAQNGKQAREEFQKEPPDIMLCDIEMPVENGLQLYNWVREHQYETCCIFLTSYAEFHYAKEAIQLGAFDYVVQPAPYREIAGTVRKAVLFVLSRKERQKIYHAGEQLLEDKMQVGAGLLRDFLLGNGNIRYAEIMNSLGAMPKPGKPCSLILIQILRWHSLAEKPGREEMAAGISRLANTVFSENSCYIAVGSMDENALAFILQRKDGQEAEKEKVKSQLLTLLGDCEKQYKCSLAAYMEGPLLLREMAEGWKKLLKRKEENVSLKSGVILTGQTETERSPYQFHTARIRHWGKLLEEGYTLAMEEEADKLLEEMAASGMLTPQSLSHFYQDFLYMLYGTMENEENLFHTMFSTPEEQELYRNGSKSIDHMKALIHYVAEYYGSETEKHYQREAVFQVINYINEHLYEDLRRDDLADYVHLNPDYMARIFKKEIGITIKEYITQRKMREAQLLLKTTSLPVSFIAAKLGYGNFSYFSQTYRKTMGTSPQKERSQEDGE